MLLAVNLRPAVVAVAPLTSRIRAGTGLSPAGVSLLTTLPLICFGLFAALAPRLSRALPTVSARWDWSARSGWRSSRSPSESHCV
jgi:CP family cyanate transporter-like MFS transporter